MLHESGTILSYVEAMKAVDDAWYYLSPSWLAKQMLKLTVSKTAKRKLSIADAERILAATLSNENQEADFGNLLNLMQKFELLLPIDDTRLLVPGKLPTEGPELEENAEGDVICRIYKMSCTAPPGFWSRLIARLWTRLSDKGNQRLSQSHKYDGSQTAALITSRRKSRHRTNSRNLVDDPNAQLSSNNLPDCSLVEQKLYWSEGFILKTTVGILRVESIKQSPLSVCSSANSPLEGVVISWQWRIVGVQRCQAVTSCAHLLHFGLAIDEVNLLISEWFPEFDYGDEKIQKFCVCPKCYSRSGISNSGRNPDDKSSTKNALSCFPLETLAALALKGDMISCPLHEEHPLLLSSLIPDLLLQDIIGLAYFIGDDLKICERIASGGQGTIFRGYYHDTEVAIKAFYAQRKDLKTSLEDLSSSQKMAKNPLKCPTITLTHASDDGISQQPNTKRPSIITTSGRFTGGRRVRTQSISEVDVELPILYAFEHMRREVCFLSSLEHPFIISLLGIIIEPVQPVSFALEYAANGNLSDMLYDRRSKLPVFSFRPGRPNNEDMKTTEDYNIEGHYYGCLLDRILIYKVAWQTVVALQYLHKQGILYRDLKSDNILVWSTDPDAAINIKLSDYGISCYTDPLGTIGAEGTRGYQAPEVLRNMAYDDKADMFSYGMVLYQLLSGLSPYQEISFADDISRLVKNGKRPSLKESNINPDYRSLIIVMEECWNPLPTDRPAAATVRKEMETLSFVALREVLQIEALDVFTKLQTFSPLSASPNAFGSISVGSPPANRSHYSFSYDDIAAAAVAAAAQSSANLLITYPGEMPFVWFVSGSENEKSASIINVNQCRYVEKDLPLPGPETLVAATFEDMILIINGSYTETNKMELFQCRSDNPIPRYIGENSFDHNHIVSSLCIIESTKTLLVGLINGYIDIYSISVGNNWQKLKTWTCSNDGKPVKQILQSTNHTNWLYVACGLVLYVLNWELCESVAHTIVFSGTEIDFMELHHGVEVLWCANAMQCQVLGYRCVNESLIQTISVDCSQYVTSFMTPNVDASRNYSRSSAAVFSLVELVLEPVFDECAVTALATGAETVYVGVSSGSVLIFDAFIGQYLGTLEPPKNDGYRTRKVTCIKIHLNTVICLVKYKDPKSATTKKFSRSSMSPSPSFRSGTMLGDKRSRARLSTSSESFVDEIQKVVLWEELNRKNIAQYQKTWQATRTFETTQAESA